MKNFYSVLKYGIAFCSLVLGFLNASAQVTVDETMTPQDLVQQVLLGEGIEVSNVTFNGLPGNQLNNQIAKYTGPSNFIAFDEGIVMAAGPAGQLVGNFGAINPNITGDPDLLMIANVGGTNFSVNNAAILEFDFVPMGDSINIRFVYMSQEYPSYTCSSFNDPFAFFLSGPGIAGPYSNNAINIALIPNSNTPIGVNTINGGVPTGGGQVANCLAANPNFVADSQYYVWNNPPQAGDVQFPGMTVTLTARAAVTCGQPHHIKLAIADASDGALDSGVVIEAGSFMSTGIDLDLFIPLGMGANDSTLLEGCGNPMLIFTRPPELAELEQFVNLEIAGTATNGTDYSTLPDSLYFAPGEIEIQIPFSAPYDLIVEGTESVTISYTTYLPCADDSVTTLFDFYILDPSPLEYVLADQFIECGDVIDLAPAITGGYGNYAIDWQNGDTGLSIPVSPNLTFTYFFTVSDTCGFPTLDGEVTVHLPVNPPLTVDAGPDQTINCLEALTSTAVPDGGNGVNTFTWSNDLSEIIGNTANLNYTTNTPGTVMVTCVDACGESAVDFFDFSFPPVPVAVDLGADFNVTCLDVTTINPQVSGGIGQYFYEWFSGAQAMGADPTLDIQLYTSSTITLNVEDECGNANTDQLIISVPPVPILVDLGEDLIVTCLDEPLLQASLTGGVGLYSYSWSLGSNEFSTDSTIVFPTDVDATITLTVNDECGNVSFDEIDLIVPAAPIEILHKNDTTICFGDNLALWALAIGGHGGYVYEWSPVFSNATWFEDRPFNTTTYIVRATDICGNTKTEEVVVTVQKFEARFDFHFLGNWGYDLVNGTSHQDGTAYYWELGDGTTSTDFQMEHYYYDQDPHLVTLYATSAIGCKDTTSRWFYPFMEVFIPSSFSPNNDGVNDVFKAQGISVVSFEMWIYTRWGEEVFYTDDIDQAWVGGFRSGDHYVESEVYGYRIKARGIRGDAMEKEGTITMLR